jgi:hypothetical protein
MDLAASRLIDLTATEAVITKALIDLRTLVEVCEGQLRELVTDDRDERVLEEWREEWLDSELRGDERFHAIIDSLLDEIEKRFDLLTTGTITKNRQGWPISWSWETQDRIDLVKAVTRFSSNYAPLFGSLLRLRVSGPGRPAPFPGRSDPGPASAGRAGSIARSSR